jgi:hypothetical protein
LARDGAMQAKKSGWGRQEDSWDDSIKKSDKSVLNYDRF